MITLITDYEDHAARTRGKQTDIMFPMSMLASEVGEAMGIVQKATFQGHDFDKTKFLLELGDAIWAISTAAVIVGSSLEEVMNLNVAKLRARYPNGYSDVESRNRKLARGDLSLAQFKDKINEAFTKATDLPAPGTSDYDMATSPVQARATLFYGAFLRDRVGI